MICVSTIPSKWALKVSPKVTRYQMCLHIALLFASVLSGFALLNRVDKVASSPGWEVRYNKIVGFCLVFAVDPRCILTG